jgi:hypothetical protein
MRWGRRKVKAKASGHRVVAGKFLVILTGLPWFWLAQPRGFSEQGRLPLL